MKRSTSSGIVGAVLLATSCGGNGAPPPNEAAPPPNDAPPAAVAEPTEEPPAVSVALLESLAAGDRAHVDPARGVIFARYYSDASGEDAAADEDGVVRSATHACGDVLDRDLARIARDLSMRFEDEAWGSMIECEGETCHIPAMGEFDLSGELTFVRSGDRVVLDRVVRVEGGPVTEDFVEAGRRWAAAQVDALRGRRCD